MLKELSKHKQFEIELLLFSTSGLLIEQLPESVSLVSTSGMLEMYGLSQKAIFGSSLIRGALRFFLAILGRIFGASFPRRIINSFAPRLNGYDYAIAYANDSNSNALYPGCTDFVLDRVIANRKIAYLHSDFLLSGANTNNNLKKLERFHRIICVSGSCARNLIAAKPSLTQKACVVHNCIDYASVRDAAEIDPVEYAPGKFHLITVARLSHEKGIMRALSVIHRLVNENHELQWHIVGDGPQMSELLSRIKDLQLASVVHVHGATSNPYRYMKNANLFFLPSYHEAAPLVFGEAQTLRIPVLSTDTLSAKEMIVKKNSGIVCENSENGIFHALDKILHNPEILDQFRTFSKVASNNDECIAQFLSCLLGTTVSSEEVFETK